MNGDITSQARCYFIWVMFFVVIAVSLGLLAAIPEPEVLISENPSASAANSVVYH